LTSVCFLGHKIQHLAAKWPCQLW